MSTTPKVMRSRDTDTVQESCCHARELRHPHGPVRAPPPDHGYRKSYAGHCEAYGEAGVNMRRNASHSAPCMTKYQLELPGGGASNA